MPEPNPHSVWIEREDGSTTLSYLRFNFFTGRIADHEPRAKKLAQRIIEGSWVCRWCSCELQHWRRSDAHYCSEHCRKKAARSRRRVRAFYQIPPRNG